MHLVFEMTIVSCVSRPGVCAWCMTPRRVLAAR